MSLTLQDSSKDMRARPSRADISVDKETPAYLANDLTDDGQTAYICHHDQIYTLRITRAGKLILTK